MDPPLPLPRRLRDPAGGWSDRDGVHVFELDRQCAPRCPEFDGVFVFRDFFDAAAERRILSEIESRPFRPAQSGKQKQHFGARVNFNERKVNARRFRGLPGYVHRIHRALRRRVASEPGLAAPRFDGLREALRAFEPTDAFVLRYHAQDASNLDFHRDDRFAYGDVIVDASFESDSVLTFVGPGDAEDDPPHCVRVPLPARSLAVLRGPARHDWAHAILAHDVRGRRTSLTLRTLADGLREDEVGRRILATAHGPAID